MLFALDSCKIWSRTELSEKHIFIGILHEFFVFRKYHSNKIWQHISYISWAFVCFSVCICFKVHLLTWQCLNSQCYYNTSISWTKHKIGPNQFTIQCFLNGNLLFLTLNTYMYSYIQKRSVKIKKTYSPNQNVFPEVSPFVLKN